MKSTQSGRFERIMRMAAVVMLSAACATVAHATSGANAVSDTTDASAANNRNSDYYFDEGVWINDIGTLLFADGDGDGYFSGLSLSIDVDTDFYSFDVFAIINISGDLDGSSRYQTEQLFTSSIFTVYGRSGSDEYRVDIDLVRNFPPGIFDLEVILVDAYDNRILDAVDSFEFRNLRSLPLESINNQNLQNPVIGSPQTTFPQTTLNDDIFFTESVGGGSGPVFAVILLMGVLFRISLRGRQR